MSDIYSPLSLWVTIYSTPVGYTAKMQRVKKVHFLIQNINISDF